MIESDLVLIESDTVLIESEEEEGGGGGSVPLSRPCGSCGPSGP